MEDLRAKRRICNLFSYATGGSTRSRSWTLVHARWLSSLTFEHRRNNLSCASTGRPLKVLSYGLSA